MGNSVSMFGHGLRFPSLPFSDDMFSGLIPGLNSVNSPEDELSGQIPPTLTTLLHLPTHFLRLFTHGIAFLRRDRSDFGTFVLWSGLVTSVALIAWSHNSQEDEDEDEDGGDTVAPPEFDAVVLGSTRRFEDGNRFCFCFCQLIMGLGFPRKSFPEKKFSRKSFLNREN
ncbi:hypothetical protein CsSME_00035653 [Camellia sinensis var. sinensis]